MSFNSWLQTLKSLYGAGSGRRAPSRARRCKPAAKRRPTLEPLEDRHLLSTFTVLNTNDSGAGSLRADIAAAQKNDAIVFAPSLNGQTVTLTSGELLINENLTITGPGAGALTISGGNASRVFEVAKGKRVALSGLTISHGAAPGVGLAGEGAGIQNYGTLTVSGSVLSGNVAAQDGGGIYNQSTGTLTVSNSALSGNRHDGIHNDGVLTVGGSTLSGNSGNFGGGIYNAYKATATVTGSTLSGNSADYGGGIWNNGALAVSGSTLSGNTAGHGGGIYNQSAGPLTVSGSTLSGNTAYAYGGGIDDYYGALTVSGSTLSGNVAGWAGGGIYNSPYNTVTVKNSSSITGNTAPVGDGADVYNSNVLYLDSTSSIGILDGNPAVPI